MPLEDEIPPPQPEGQLNLEQTPLSLKDQVRILLLPVDLTEEEANVLTSFYEYFFQQFDQLEPRLLDHKIPHADLLPERLAVQASTLGNESIHAINKAFILLHFYVNELAQLSTTPKEKNDIQSTLFGLITLKLKQAVRQENNSIKTVWGLIRDGKGFGTFLSRWEHAATLTEQENLLKELNNSSLKRDYSVKEFLKPASDILLKLEIKENKIRPSGA